MLFCSLELYFQMQLGSLQAAVLQEPFSFWEKHLCIHFYECIYVLVAGCCEVWGLLQVF